MELHSAVLYSERPQHYRENDDSSSRETKACTGHSFYMREMCSHAAAAAAAAPALRPHTELYSCCVSRKELYSIQALTCKSILVIRALNVRYVREHYTFFAATSELV